VSVTLRRAVALLGTASLGGFYIWSLTGLPDFGSFRGISGRIINHAVVAERHATNAISAVNFDYRAFDTLGEELILFTAVAGVMTLLREQRGERPQAQEGGFHEAREVSDAVRVFGIAMIALTAMVGIYVTAHGHLTPGGGFQGGVLIATAILLVYLAHEYVVVDRLRPLPPMEALHAIGAAAFVCLGLGGILAGGALFHNFVALGTPGMLLSAGTIPLNSVAVGIEVTGGFLLVFSEFIEEAVVVSRGGE
jgi:multicomponent Na+:H+ antiporter subunit B